MILIILNIVAILFWAYILNYLIKLEKLGCECSKDWRRPFITYFVVYLIILLLLSTFNIWTVKQLPPILMVVNYVLMIFFFITVYQYIHKLKKEKCECSENEARNILEIVNYIQLALVLLSLIMMIYAMFMVSKFLKTNNIKSEDSKSISNFITNLKKSKKSASS